MATRGATILAFGMSSALPPFQRATLFYLEPGLAGTDGNVATGAGGGTR
jgi:hypothetical protein